MRFFSKEVFTLCTILGSLQVNVHPLTKQVEFSHKLFYWSLSITVTQVVSTIMAFVLDYINYLHGHIIRLWSTTSAVAVLFDLLPLTLCSLFTFLSAYKLYPSLIRIFVHLSTVDSILNLEEVEQPKRPGRILALVAYLSVCLVYTFYVSSKRRYFFIVYVPPWSVYYVNLALILCFLETVQSIDLRLRKVNLYLRKEVLEHSFGEVVNSQCLPSVEVTTKGENTKYDQQQFVHFSETYFLNIFASP